jgi:Putative 2OG-Fe(II) oxygenase
MNPAEKIKNKMARQASLIPTTYIVEPKVLTKVDVYDLNLDISPEQITNSILNFRTEHETSNASNVKAWHSDWYTHHKTKDFDTLIKIVEDRILKSVSTQISKINTVECVESWAMIYKKGDSAVFHKHSDQTYAAVYYAKVEDNASPIIFDNNLSVTPKLGTLVCFPGWLWHHVPEIIDDQERICMAFNLNCLITIPKELNEFN